MSNAAIEVFDRRLLKMRRDRAATKMTGFDFIYEAVADILVDRLAVIKKEFPLIVDLGGGHGLLAKKLRERAGTEMVFLTDLSLKLLASADENAVAVDEEFLPFAADSLDAVTSNLSLQWVNDLPGALMQVKNALKPDGLFMAAVLGGESLKELRQCMMEAELDVTGGASPRVSPLLDLRDMGALLQRAGFALPVIDSDIITVDYTHPLKLMQDLRGMGASNAVLNRIKTPTRKSVLLRAAEIYIEKFADEKGHVPATFEIIYAIGWKPHHSQPQPLKPGSATRSLIDVL